MKRMVLSAILLTLLASLFLCGGCGGAQNDGPVEDGANGKAEEDIDRIEFDKGFEDGQAQGYARGYSDGRDGVYSPEIEEPASPNDHYNLGYTEGWLEGYEKGYGDAVEEGGDAEEETAAIEEAMLAFASQNSAPGLEFEIKDLVIHGDEAAAMVVCTNEDLDTAFVMVKRGSGGWYGVDFGTGIEMPSWYEP